MGWGGVIVFFQENEEFAVLITTYLGSKLQKLITYLEINALLKLGFFQLHCFM